MADSTKLNEPVTNGERLMLDRLSRALPADWHVFGNPMVRAGQSTREIDAIVVGSAGVWAVDEKGFGGRIEGDSHAWVLPSGAIRERPLDLVDHTAKVLKGCLKEADPSLADVWVEGVIILSALDADPSGIRDDRVNDRVVRLADAVRWFTADRGQHLSAAQVQAVGQAVAGAKWLARRQGRLELPGYEVVERGAVGGLAQTYRCRHQRSGEMVEARVYDLSGLPSQKAREECLRGCEREATALRKLRDTSHVLRVAETFQPLPGYGGELYWMALDVPEGPCLGARMRQPDWPLSSRLRAARRLCEVVRDIHAAQVLHRHLHPGCLHLHQTAEDFLVSGFEFARVAASTLALPEEEFPAGPYTAPEVAASYHSASAASDIYSLGVILYELLVGRLPYGDRPRQPDDLEPAFSLAAGADQPAWSDDLGALIQLMVARDPAARPQDLNAVVDELEQLIAAPVVPPAGGGGEEPPAGGGGEEPPAGGGGEEPPQHPLPCGARLGDYVVLEYLGTGGCFHAYKVADARDDSRVFVAKAARDPGLIETAGTAFSALHSLRHPNLVRAQEVRTTATASYHLLEDLVEGPTAADRRDDGPVPAMEAAAWAAALGDALQYLETRPSPIYHGDITPRNIVVGANGPVLIDFSLAYLPAEQDDPGGVRGTAPYRPPERDLPDTPWPPSGDVYGLGMTLCELLFGTLPYDTTMGYDRRALQEALFGDPTTASLELLALLRRAIAPDAADRFPSAAAFCEALAQTPERGGQPRPQFTQRGEAPYLAEALQVYNRGDCNAENRGLDSDFARRTYVPTNLDRELGQEILDRRYALVVLTGNPGDGKTAFLQQLAMALGRPAEALELHHWEIEVDGWTFECVLDGSASDTGRGLRSSEEVLRALLAPVEAAGEAPGLADRLKRTQLLAINEGRLLEYLDDQDGAGWLGEHLNRLLGEAEGEPHADLALVDLNRRALAYGAGDELETVLEALVEGGAEGQRPADPWSACGTCRAARSCHVRFNVATLRDPEVGPRVRERLRSLLMTVHSRGRLHVTMRELRSTLGLAFFGTQTCAAIHEALEQGADAAASQAPTGLYFDQLFGRGAAGGPLLEQLGDFDPAETDCPRLDRLLLRDLQGLAEVLPAPPGRLPYEPLATADAPDHRLRAARRQAFFEAEPADLGPDVEAPWLSLTPFRSAGTWLACLEQHQAGDRDLPADLCRRLCRAVSLTDNVPEALTTSHLVVRTAASTKTPLVVLRLFEQKRFSLVWEEPRGKALTPNALPCAMLLRYDGGEPTLEITADLFELLLRADQGYRLGSDELQAMAGQLQLFKNRLLAMPAMEVVLEHPTLGRYRASQRRHDGVQQIVLEEGA